MIEALDERSVSYLVTPLLQVEATFVVADKQSIQNFGQADIIIFISTNAVKYTDNALAGNWPTTPHYYAVGEATFQALADLGIAAHKAPKECQQTEGLLTLPQLQTLTDKKVVIVRGVGGREKLALELQARGGQLNYWEVYQRSAPQLAAKETTQAWQQAGIDTIIVTSGEILDNLIKLVPKELFAWLRACHIIVPSSRVHEQALAYGFLRVTNAKAANCKAVLSALSL